MAESGFLTNIFKLSFQLCVATTTGTAVMLYAVIRKDPVRNSALVLAVLTEGFLVFTQCLNLPLGKVPGSGHLFLPNSIQFIFHQSPIIRRSVVFDKEVSLLFYDTVG